MRYGIILLISFMNLSCYKSLEDVCTKEFSEIDLRIVAAIHRLEVEKLTQRRTREPASLSERLDWESWGVSRLKEAEQYLDIVGHDKVIQEIKTELSQIVNLWVDFHGFSQQGDADKMLTKLQEIHDLQGKAKDAACSLIP